MRVREPFIRWTRLNCSQIALRTESCAQFRAPRASPRRVPIALCTVYIIFNIYVIRIFYYYRGVSCIMWCIFHVYFSPLHHTLYNIVRRAWYVHIIIISDIYIYICTIAHHNNIVVQGPIYIYMCVCIHLIPFSSIATLSLCHAFR